MARKGNLISVRMDLNRSSIIIWILFLLIYFVLKGSAGCSGILENNFFLGDIIYIRPVTVRYLRS